MAGQYIFFGIFAVVSLASLVTSVLAYRMAHRKVEGEEEKEDNFEQISEDAGDLVGTMDTLAREAEKLGKEAQKLARAADDGIKSLPTDGFFYEKTITRSQNWVVTCPHCKQPNRLNPEKTGQVLCGKCGLPVRLTVVKG